MAMGPLNRKKTLIGRVRVFTWGWSMAMGPLKRKRTLAGRVRVFKCGWSMAMGRLKRKRTVAGRVRDGHGAFEKEEDPGWECQGV